MSTQPLSVRLLFLGDPTRDRRIQNFLRVLNSLPFVSSCELIYGIPGENRKSEISIAGCRALQVPVKYKSGPLMFIDFDRKLRAALTHHRCDVVIASDLYSLSAGRRAKTSGSARWLIYDAREVYTKLPSVVDRSGAEQVWRFAERLGLRYTDLLIVTGPTDAEEIFEVHKMLPRSLLIRNVPMSVEADSEAVARAELGMPSDATIFVYLGGLQPHRGIDKFIRAMPLMPESFHFLIIGSGSERKQLESLAASEGVASRVRFYGAIEAESAIAVLKACDAGVTLIEPVSRSYELALPSKLFEYMAANLRVLSTPLEQVVELFAGEDWISFCEDLSPDAIAHAAEVLVNGTITVASKDRFLRSFSFESEAVSLGAWLKNRADIPEHNPPPKA